MFSLALLHKSAETVVPPGFLVGLGHEQACTGEVPHDERPGERVMACDFDRQVTELQVRASILNRFTSLGTPRTLRVA